MKALMTVLAYANADQINCVVSHRDLRTPLHIACSSVNLPIAQLLLWVSVNAFFIMVYAVCHMTNNSAHLLINN